MQANESAAFIQEVDFYEKLNAVTSQVQDDIARVLLLDPDHHREVQRQLKQSEEKMQLEMNHAIRTVMSKMAVASMNRANLFTHLLGMHSTITGDPTIHRLLAAVDERVLAKHFN